MGNCFSKSNNNSDRRSATYDVQPTDFDVYNAGEHPVFRDCAPPGRRTMGNSSSHAIRIPPTMEYKTSSDKQFFHRDTFGRSSLQTPRRAALPYQYSAPRSYIFPREMDMQLSPVPMWFSSYFDNDAPRYRSSEMAHSFSSQFTPMWVHPYSATLAPSASARCFDSSNHGTQVPVIDRSTNTIAPPKPARRDLRSNKAMTRSAYSTPIDATHARSLSSPVSAKDHVYDEVIPRARKSSRETSV